MNEGNAFSLEENNKNSLYELTTKIDEVPCSNTARRMLLRLLEEYGTIGDQMGKMLWLNDTVDVIDRIRELASYIVADSNCFKYELDGDWQGVLDGITYIRFNLGKLLN